MCLTWVIILYSILAWFRLKYPFNRFEKSSMYSSKNKTTRHWYNKNYMNFIYIRGQNSAFICLVCLWFVWLAQRYNHAACGSNSLKSFSRYRRFFMRWTLFCDVVKLFPPYLLSCKFCHVCYFCDRLIIQVPGNLHFRSIHCRYISYKFAQSDL